MSDMMEYIEVEPLEEAELREWSEARWTNGQDDPADARFFGSFRTIEELKNIRPPTYNIGGLLQQGTTALLWGLPGAIKTTTAVGWWGHLSLGLDWCDAQVAKGVTFYLPLEDRAGFRARVDA